MTDNTSGALIVRRSPRRLLVKTGTVPLAFATLGAVFGLFDPRMAAPAYTLAAAFGVFVGAYVIGAALDRKGALALSEDGVRWRGLWLARSGYLPWSRVAAVRLEAYSGRYVDHTRLRISLRPTGQPTLIAEPMIVLDGLDADPEAILEAFGRYVFVQDDR